MKGGLQVILSAGHCHCKDSVTRSPGFGVYSYVLTSCLEGTELELCSLLCSNLVGPISEGTPLKLCAYMRHAPELIYNISINECTPRLIEPQITVEGFCNQASAIS